MKPARQMLTAILSAKGIQERNSSILHANHLTAKTTTLTYINGPVKKWHPLTVGGCTSMFGGWHKWDWKSKQRV